MERIELVIYRERDLYLRCDRSSGHRTKMGKGPDGSDGGSVIRFRFTKRRGKGTKRARKGIKLEAVFHSGPRVRGFVSLSVPYVFFCIAGAYPVWHARDPHTPTHPSTSPFFRAVELPSMKKFTFGKSASCAPGTWSYNCPDPFLDRNRSHWGSLVRVLGQALLDSCRPFTRTRIRLTGYGQGFPLGISQLITCFWGVTQDTQTHTHTHFQKALLPSYSSLSFCSFHFITLFSSPNGFV